MCNGKILVVDDEKDLRRMLVRFLELEDYECLEAKNGREAFEILSKEKVSFVISDIRMPGGDGVELLKSIKKRNPEIPAVLLMTGFAEVDRNEIINLGALDLLSKPIDLNIILGHLNGM